MMNVTGWPPMGAPRLRARFIDVGLYPDFQPSLMKFVVFMAFMSNFLYCKQY